MRLRTLASLSPTCRSQFVAGVPGSHKWHAAFPRSTDRHQMDVSSELFEGLGLVRRSAPRGSQRGATSTGASELSMHVLVARKHTYRRDVDTVADAAAERDAVRATLAELGPAAASGCGQWTTTELAVHLALGEVGRGAVNTPFRWLVGHGIRLDAVSPMNERALRLQVRRHDFHWALERLSRPLPALQTWHGCRSDTARVLGPP